MNTIKTLDLAAPRGETLCALLLPASHPNRFSRLPGQVIPGQGAPLDMEFDGWCWTLD